MVGDLDLVPTFEVAPKSNAQGEGDGYDYIEGGGGNDVIFGGLGQDEIIGGSSDFFSLNTPDKRPDGADIIFGDGGIHSDRNDNGGLAPGAAIPLPPCRPTPTRSSATTAASSRIVGTKGVDLCGATCEPGETFYVSYKYDDVYGPSGQILVRGVTLLDYTPGGPDFRPDRFFDPNTPGACSSSAVETQDGCSPLYVVRHEPRRRSVRRPARAARAGWWEIFANDEIHGGLGDDFVYLGGGNDVVYGDADDDEIIGGWGNDWIDGGVGQDAIIGDDGRIFGSRNSSTGWTAAGTPCTGSGNGTCYSEPLNAITALSRWACAPPTIRSRVRRLPRPVHRHAWPGADGDHQHRRRPEEDRRPDALQPVAERERRRPAEVRRQQLRRRDLRRTRRCGGAELPDRRRPSQQRGSAGRPGRRGVFGDFLHGGAGDDAIAGGEAIWNGYTQLYDRTNDDLLPQAYRTDWTRPFNPGDLLHFGQDDDAWHNTGPIVDRLGEFALYDEYDPRRTIMLNADGTPNKNNDPNALAWFLNLYSNEGPSMVSCVEFAPSGACIRTGPANSDGSDALFGDEGNDWLVGGTGQDSMYGGWGNDLLNADDVLTVEGTGTFGDQKGRKIQPSPNDIPDTHFFYNDRAFGGAGLDVLIGNTGGDRLIDWVGEFNSYIVPFAPFGIATVSRQVPPWLYEFLYSMSASQGADPTRDEDQNANDPDLEARNGEPFGELGLVTPARPRPVAGPDGRSVRPAARQHPGRPARRQAPCRLQRRTDAVDGGRLRRVGGQLRRPLGTGGVAGPGRRRRLVPRPVPARLLRDRRPREARPSRPPAGRATPL